MVRQEGAKEAERIFIKAIRPEKKGVHLEKLETRFVLTSLDQNSPADMLEYMISSRAGGGHADLHLKMVEINMWWRCWKDGSAARSTGSSCRRWGWGGGVGSQHAHSALEPP